MQDSINAIQATLSGVEGKIKKCHQLKSRANDEQKKQLGDMELKLEAQRGRLAVALDILHGRDYVVYNIDGELTVVRPSESTAKLIQVAEEMGGKVTELPSIKEKEGK